MNIEVCVLNRSVYVIRNKIKGVTMKMQSNHGLKMHVTNTFIYYHPRMIVFYKSIFQCMFIEIAMLYVKIL